MDKKKACRKEVLELHQFFQDWATGVLPNTDDAFERLGSALTDDFTIATPDGRLHFREELLELLRPRNGAERDGRYRIWIENDLVYELPGGVWLVVYQEWQEKDGDVKGRLSTAVFVDRDGTPNGIAWRHVHETWLPPRS